MLMPNCFRRTALIILMCTMAAFDCYSQLAHLVLENDTLLKPDTNNVVRTAFADSIVYSYYFDKAHSKLRSRYVYSLDNTYGREVVFIQTYCFSGRKALEETFKNYNRRLKTLDKEFTISKSVIANDGKKLNPIFHQFTDQVKYYTKVGAELGWYCSGNRHDSTWNYPTKKYLKYSGTNNGETYRFRLNNTEQRGVGYSWYESGNIEEELFYQKGALSAIFVYYDSGDRKLYSKSIYAKNKNSKGAADLTCHYYQGGTLKDSVITDSKTKEELEKYYYHKNGLKSLVYIDGPGFKVSESYDSTGQPSRIERKVLYKGKWYECKKLWFSNGQLADSWESKQFYLLHPEYGSLPDSLLYTSEAYLPNGTKTFYKYTHKNGLTYAFVYRKDGTLEKKVIFNRERMGTETEYDEKGVSINQKNIDLNKK